MSIFDTITRAQPGSLIAAGLLLLSGCTSGDVRPAPVAARAPMTGDVGRVLGRSATQLNDLFGAPDQDVRAMDGRRLQFASAVCVLDAYLYRKGSGEAVVTWIDTRAPTGTDIDRASCIAALSRRKAAR